MFVRWFKSPFLNTSRGSQTWLHNRIICGTFSKCWWPGLCCPITVFGWRAWASVFFKASRWFQWWIRIKNLWITSYCFQYNPNHPIVWQPKSWPSKDVYLLIPWTINMLPYMAKGNLQVSDSIKDPELGRLSWIIQVSLIYFRVLQGKGLQKSQCQSDSAWDRLQQPLLAFKMEGSHKPRNTGRL